MKYDVFISYSREDLSLVEPLVKDIEKRAGVKCWIDWNGIESGSQFEDVIIKAINSVDVVLFFISESSINSEYAKMEVNYAYNTNKKVVPVVLDGGDLRDWFLFKFGSIDYIDIHQNQQYNKLVHNLQAWCGTMQHNHQSIPQSKYNPISESVSNESVQPGQNFNLKKVVLGISLLLVICFIGVFLLKRDQFSDKTDYDVVECRANDIVFNMVKVPAGSFIMGGYDEDAPLHRVTISNEFLIGETEVTQKLWSSVMNNNPSQFIGDELPVNNVSWNDCMQFIDKLNDITGETYRLPTEAEWEYAAKIGYKEFAYSGSDLPDSVAWYIDNSAGQLRKVKSKRDNEIGAYDMSGNVWEWCADYYEIYDINASLDPIGPKHGVKRVRRGGSYKDNARCCLVTFRSRNSPDVRRPNQGFRLAKTISQTKSSESML